MSLTNLVVSSGAICSVAGGADLTFATDGQTIANGLSLIVPADADYRVRRRAVFTYQPPKVAQATGEYTRDRKSVSYTLPMVLANGKVVFNTIRIDRQVHPELTAANALDLCVVGSQLLFDADVLSFWAVGSTS